MVVMKQLTTGEHNLSGDPTPFWLLKGGHTIFLEVGGSHERGTDWPRGMSFSFFHFHAVSF